ncbi:hypothetical protein [Oryza sativa Japonica Group]|uniref:Uncharacterized protein n=1 Tax=Oryza sativa subsp. japonica TaxID=39947 RepID=Q8LRH6_ORYSJ|nr:hypothetical protein [Oryza sativa Japonica Group]
MNYLVAAVGRRVPAAPSGAQRRGWRRPAAEWWRRTAAGVVAANGGEVVALTAVPSDAWRLEGSIDREKRKHLPLI